MRAADLVKPDVLVNGVPAVRCRSSRTARRPHRGRALLQLKQLISAADVRVPIQAIGSRVICAETMARCKNVLPNAGGDITRKRASCWRSRRGSNA